MAGVNASGAGRSPRVLRQRDPPTAWEEVPLPAAQQVEEVRARKDHWFADVARLLEEWKLETSQPELFREAWTVCRGIAQYANWEFEKFTELLRSPERQALLRLFEQGLADLRALDRLHAAPEVEALTRHVQRRKQQALQERHTPCGINSEQQEKRPIVQP